MSIAHHLPRRASGFTFIELMVTLALLGVLAMSTLPLFEVTATRMRESELRQSLRTLRAALDAYKAAVDQGQIARETGQSGYPPSLEILVEGVDVVNATNAVAADGARPLPKRLYFLRQIPRDPFHPDASVPAAQTWRTRAYGSPPDNPQPGDDVFDVTSSSTRVGLNGVPYAAW
jgi:general secretion pathway protein G